MLASSPRAVLRSRSHRGRSPSHSWSILCSGALVTLGIGNYAPSLVVFSLLGMDPRAAFPIMAGSALSLQRSPESDSSARAAFIGALALGLAVGGIPGVVVAAWLVKSLPLEALRWLVLVVATYAAVTLLRAGISRSAPTFEGAIGRGSAH